MALQYRLAKSLATLRDNLNAMSPNRNRISDGWIGDLSHSKRVSDHNPVGGVVHALDITNDPAHGVDGNRLAEALIEDPRVKYVIWNRRIWNARGGGWRPYTGKNPHTKHVHTSVKPDKANFDNDKPWNLGIAAAAEAAANLPPVEHMKPTLVLGDQGAYVEELQMRLGPPVKVDGDFGPKTPAAVKAFQKKHDLVADGMVGPYTWEALETKGEPVKPVILNKTTGEPAVPPPPVVPEIAPERPPEASGVGTPRWAIEYLKELGWPEKAAVA